MNTGRRILIVASFVNLAGAQIAALRVARGLRDRGHDPKVVFLYEANPIPAPDHPYEVLLARAGPGIGGYLSFVPGLMRMIRRERPDRVLTFMPLASVVGLACAAIGGCAGRVVSQRVPVDTIRPVWRVLDMAWAWLGIYTDVIAVSESVRLSCRGYPQRLLARTAVVHNGLLGWRRSALGPEAARRRFAVADGAVALVAVGRLAPQKNYPLMLRILQHVEGAVLLIAGEGRARAALEALANEFGVAGKVRFLGALARQDVPDLLAAADIFVQTSTFEGQSNAVLEALQAGLPIIAHDIPEQRETIAEPDGATAGELVPVGDVDAWVAAIERLRSDPTAASAARRVAGRRARLFSYETMIDGFESVLIGGG